MAKGRFEPGSPDEQCQRVVCFTETPLEHTYLLTQEIEARQFKFEPYGIAIPKRLARRIGINPVWYLDITPGHDWLTGPVESLIEESRGAYGFSLSDIARITPF